MYPGRITSGVISLLVLLILRSVSALRKPRTIFTIMPTNRKNEEDMSVLKELKDTVQKQKAEIEALQKQLLVGGRGSAKKASSHSHGAHGGGGGEESMEDLAVYLASPFYKIAAKRVGWLSFFLCSLSFTALIMNGFEHTLERQIELAYFVPLLAGHGGNTGGQTVGTILSALSSGAITLKDAPKVIAKEAMSGMMAGIILGLGVGPIAHKVMGISLHVSTVVLCTLPFVSTIAATLGAAIPFACVLVGLDPSVIAAPAMTSFVDISGLMAYFLIANQVFKFYGLEL